VLARQRTPSGSHRAIAAPSAPVSKHTRSTTVVKRTDSRSSAVQISCLGLASYFRFGSVLGMATSAEPE
jgi:hypothetical protein